MCGGVTEGRYSYKISGGGIYQGGYLGVPPSV